MKASTQNYFNEVKKAKRQGIKEKVLKCFDKDNFWTSFELQMQLGYKDLTTVSRRMAELENDGLIYQTGSTVKANENIYAIYKLTPFEEIADKRFKRWKSRRIDWIKQGLNFGYITKEESQVLDK
jgi:predicted transcriptional regulator